MSVDSPAFARAFDLARHALLLVERFPRHRRAVLGRRLEEQALTLHEALARAARRQLTGDVDGALRALDEADVALVTFGFALRLAGDLGLVSVGETGVFADRLAELGRLVGGWSRKLRSSPPR
jgi:hypothetical protein